MKIIYIFTIILLLISSYVLAQEKMERQIIVDAGYKIITYTNQPTTFEAKAFSVDGEEIIKYEWDFDGDGTTELVSEKGKATYTYHNNGQYVVKVTITNSAGEIGNDFNFVTVKGGAGEQKNIEYIIDDKGKLKNYLPPDGKREYYAILINGHDPKKNWPFNYAKIIYEKLKENFSYDDDHICFFGYKIFDEPSKSFDISYYPDFVDYISIKENIEDYFLNELPNIIDGDDQLLFIFVGHGGGYNKSRYSSGGGRPSVNEADDEKDYLESEFKCNGIKLDNWYYEKSKCIDNTIMKIKRVKFVSSFSELETPEGNYISDNDPFIEKIANYLSCDNDYDGILEFANCEDIVEVKEAIDCNGNDILFNHDEGDWSDKYRILKDNKPLKFWSPFSFHNESLIFDYNFDNHLDVDINTVCDINNIGSCNISLLNVDGTDTDNDGVFDRIDVNLDGDYNDWISWDEALGLPSVNLYDDDLNNYLSYINPKNCIFILGACYSGGFINDISENNRIIFTAAGEEETGWTVFTKKFIDVLKNPQIVDINNDGFFSMVEICNYINMFDFCTPSVSLF